MGDSRAPADQPTSPSHAFGAGPSLSPLKGGEGQVVRAGLVATNSIRGGANRRVLDELEGVDARSPRKVTPDSCRAQGVGEASG